MGLLKPLLSFGEALIDFLQTAESSVDGLMIPEYRQFPGGAPASVAVAFARLGGKARFAGQVGEDPFGRFLEGSLVHYGVDPQGDICDDDKYFWVQAESFAAAARLAVVTGESRYWDWYARIWDYADRHMVDKQYGAWFRVLDRRNNKLSSAKSTAGGKCDYHTIGACCDVIGVLSVDT